MERMFSCFPITIVGESRNTPHVHDFHELVFVRSGCGRQQTPFGGWSVGAGELFFFPAGVTHVATCAPGERQDMTVVYFDDLLFSPRGAEVCAADALKACVAWGRRCSKVPVSAATAPELAVAFADMVHEAVTRRAGYAAKIKSALLSVFVAIARDPTDGGLFRRAALSPSPQQLIRDVEAYVRAHWDQPIAVADVLSWCPLSRSHFHVLFRRFVGSTFGEYLLRVRVAESCGLLRDPEIPIRSIAERCAFATHSHFTNTFTRRMGMSPRAYRAAAAAKGWNHESDAS